MVVICVSSEREEKAIGEIRAMNIFSWLQRCLTRRISLCLQMMPAPKTRVLLCFKGPSLCRLRSVWVLFSSWSLEAPLVQGWAGSTLAPIYLVKAFLGLPRAAKLLSILVPSLPSSSPGGDQLASPPAAPIQSNTHHKPHHPQQQQQER